jgi:hypothetical protein
MELLRYPIRIIFMKEVCFKDLVKVCMVSIMYSQMKHIQYHKKLLKVWLVRRRNKLDGLEETENFIRLISFKILLKYIINHSSS